MASGTLEEVHDVEFDEKEGSQSEAQNLDDVRDQLANAMKNMDVGDIRPRQVDDDNGDIHMINKEVQINANEANTSGVQTRSTPNTPIHKYSKGSSIGSSHWWYSKWCTN